MASIHRVLHRVLQRANLRSHNTQRIISTKPFSYYESPNVPTIFKQQPQNHNATNDSGTVVRRNGVVATIFATSETARRSFSSVSANVKTKDEPRMERRAVPTRHSRHHLPEVAPFDSLEGLSAGLLDVVPGTLFVYDAVDLQLIKDDEYENGLSRSYETQQLIEYILRGYNITFPNSLVQNTHPKSVTDQRWKQFNNHESDDSYYVRTLEKMIALLDRIELEGSVYVELRSNFRSQLAHRNANGSHDTTPPTDTDTDTQIQQAQAITHLNNTYGAPPGPSTIMYDLILDAISLTIPHLPPSSAITWIQRASELNERALERHDSDTRAKTPPNADSVPSALTFNAVIRAAANAPYDGSNEELRDVALGAALGSYDAMHHHAIVERNSATYRYVLQVVGKYVPPCPSKGNMAYGLFVKACEEEGVLDETVVDAVMNYVRTFENGSLEKADSLGVDFDHWIDDTLKVTFDESKNGYGFPRKWSSNKRKRRYDKRFATY